MLIRLAVENFRSVDKRIELSMVPNNYLAKFTNHIAKAPNISLLKSAFIYGANAAGKTNIIRAVSFVKTLLQDGIEETEIYNQQNRNSKANDKKPSIFEFVFLKNEIAYNYGFAIILSTGEVEGEWLYIVSPNKQDEMLFDREKNEILYNRKLAGNSTGRIDTYIEDIKTMEPTLFLSELARKKIVGRKSKFFTHINNAFSWFEDITIITPSTKINSLMPYVEEGSDSHSFVEMMKKFDTGVTGLVKVPSTVESFYRDLPNMTIANRLLSEIKTRLLKRNRVEATIRLANQQYYFELNNEGTDLEVSKLVCTHKNTSALFELCDESDGTNRLFDIIPILLCTEEKEKVFFVDELDRSLHPNLVIEFIKMYFLNTQGCNHQLIATTHQAELMDLDLLRRDEIWIVDRNADGSSKLYSLDEFRVRSDKDTTKAYLQGRYGGVPLFADDIVPKEVNVISEDMQVPQED